MNRRLILFFIFVGIFSGFYWAGAGMEVSEDEAALFMEEFNKLVDGIDGFGIFVHNLTIAMPMFVPGFGIAFGLFSAWSTGMAFSAITTTMPELKIHPLEILYLSPFGIMELTAYSIATSRSYMLIHALVKKIPVAAQLKKTGMEVGIVLILLLAGGYLEFYMIEAAQEAGHGISDF